MGTNRRQPALLSDRRARRLVQLGFLLLFLYPYGLILYQRLTLKPAPVLTSWLLPFDPLLALGQLGRGNLAPLVIGAPLLLLVLTTVFGRSFCGWVCPMGTLLDLVRPLAFWRRRQKGAGRRTGQLPLVPANANGPLRYWLLAAAVAGAVLSLQLLGVLDPLVIFERGMTVLVSDGLMLSQPAFRTFLTASVVFLVLLLLELWQPRFWCRHLCPTGALLGLAGRLSLVNRVVSDGCNNCGQCRKVCTMRAIPAEGHDTSYQDCHVCLECEEVCPQGAISFRFGALAARRWQSLGKARDEQGKMRFRGRYRPDPAGYGYKPSRRGFVAALAAGTAGVLLPPAVRLSAQQAILRPPGALPEADFTRTCILCQECVRVCPTGSLRPVLFEAGGSGIGTPRFIPRVGSCSLNPSCPQLCAQACPVAAIRSVTPIEMKIGRAVVDRHLCLAWDQGTKCLVCVEACLNGAAQAYNGRVTVDPNKCSGCGRCENACPIVDAAIHVRPV